MVNCGDQRLKQEQAGTLMLPLDLQLLIIVRTGKKEQHMASFFSNKNDEATREREILAEESLEMLIAWLHEGGNVAIHGTCI